MCSSSTVIFLSNSFGVHVHLIHVRSVSSVVHTIFSSELKQVFPRNRHTHTFNIVPYAAAFPHMNEHCRRWMQRSQLDECYFALWLNSNIFNKFIRFLLSFVLSLYFFRHLNRTAVVLSLSSSFTLLNFSKCQEDALRAIPKLDDFFFPLLLRRNWMLFTRFSHTRTKNRIATKRCFALHVNRKYFR